VEGQKGGRKTAGGVSYERKVPQRRPIAANSLKSSMGSDRGYIEVSTRSEKNEDPIGQQQELAQGKGEKKKMDVK